MKRCICLISVFMIFGCARTVEPTFENINKIFSSRDFTFEFHEKGKSCRSMSFRNDYVVFQGQHPTIRREISFDEVLLINDFIKKIVRLHNSELDQQNSSYYVIKNTAYETIITPKLEDFYYRALLNTLKVDY